MAMNNKGRISSLGTVLTFIKKGTCSQTSCHVLNRAFNQPLPDEECAAMPFAGGMLRHGYQCGLLWGAALAAGARTHRQFGAGPAAETRAVLAAQRLVPSFRAQNRHINCLEITEIGRSSTTMQMITFFLIKGGTLGCFRRAARYARTAFSDINATLCEQSADTPPAPASCSALLARKLGASDLHTMMVAGLAGGIGLSGEACGALGAAIWLSALNNLRKEDGKVKFDDPRAATLIDRFLKCTDYEFECSKIVGRKFDSVSDHAAYLSGGGCSKILEVLSTGESTLQT